MRTLKRHLLAIPAWALLVTAILLPLVLLSVFSLWNVTARTPAPFGHEWVVLYREAGTYGPILVRSLLLGLGATVVTVLFGLPTAWVISRYVKRKGLVLGLIIAPGMISNLLLIYAFFVLLSPGGLSSFLVNTLGMGSLLYTKWAVLLILSYIHFPLMTVALFTTVERIDRQVVRAARSLGASAFRRVRTIILPLAAPGMLAGLVIVFTPSAGSFVEAKILGGADGMMFGTMIDGQLSAVNNDARAAAMSFVLLASIFCLLGVLFLVLRKAFPGALRRRG